MRKITTLLLVGLAFLYAAEGFAQRGIGTNLPHRSSVLELESGTRGLLIPRFDLTALNDPSPVADPANSLLVYNTKKNEGANLSPGYYYWLIDNVTDPALPGDATPGQWIPLLNTAGNNIEIDDNGVVSVKPGELVGQVLVTVEDDGELTSEWVNISEILEDLFDIDGTNGIEVIPVPADIDPITGVVNTPPSFIVKIDGNLTENTTITTNAGDPDDPDNNDIWFSIESSGNQFFIENLNEIEVNDDGTITGTGTPGGPGIPGDTGTAGNDFKDFFDVLIVNRNTGLVQRVSVEDLLRSAIDAKNGLTYDRDGNVIKLGGNLIEETTITLDGNEFIIDTSEDSTDLNSTQAAGDLKIIGLEEVDAANKIIVVDVDNNVRTITRVISKDITEALDMSSDLSTAWPEYSPYVQEVNINVTALISAETDLVLPEATAANEGQVINISLTIGSESSNYLNIKKEAGTVVENTNILTWGALPYQSWVLKSNGVVWRVVSSN